MNPLNDIIVSNRVRSCLECGKCSAVCPITRWETQAYASPRLLVEKVLLGTAEAVTADPLFWACLSCKRCAELCPSAVFFAEFMRDARSLARQAGLSGPCTHGEVIQTWARIMADPQQCPERLGWLPENPGTSETADTVYFVGCLPFYDVLFGHLNFEGVAIARATLKILNAMGIAPRVMAGERCCGHDQLWQGDLETFEALAELNLKQLAGTGAKRIVTSCPECARTLALDYPQRLGDHGMEVVHIAQLAARAAAEGELSLKPLAAEPLMTYQDPCRLGRHLGVYAEPRELLARLGGRLAEMTDNRRAAQCCGTSCWTACGQASKAIQVERLEQAKRTGADLLVTACVKCQIHFRCAQQDTALQERIGIDIRDITTLVAEQLAPAPEAGHAGQANSDGHL